MDISSRIACKVMFRNYTEAELNLIQAPHKEAGLGICSVLAGCVTLIECFRGIMSYVASTASTRHRRHMKLHNIWLHVFPDTQQAMTVTSLPPAVLLEQGGHRMLTPSQLSYTRML